MSHEIEDEFSINNPGSAILSSGWMTEKDWEFTFECLEESRRSIKELTQQIIREREERNRKNGIIIPEPEIPNFTYELTNLDQNDSENSIQYSDERLVLSPAAAKILLEKLERDVQLYEKEVGEI
ncbi:hypothetical protein MsAg5_17470 [Methanosarcinaceae archaeon Ag5]|uniref:Uncharacterized protein n=2 Tax=Methanolapillus africanus TaxID=3028297 RepID=A0AAE4ML52_9EURY|nr:hypothetical protein [Methanosarcinaceae archaeon Ag5]